MAGLFGISNPSVRANGQVISIKPNTLDYTSGVGERAVNPITAGGESTTPVITEDASTKKSMLKFALDNSSKSIQVKDSLQTNFFNEFEIIADKFSIVFKNMVMINDPEIPLSHEGEIELEFEGSPVING